MSRPIPQTTVKLEARNYGDKELEELADQILREDADRELCRECKAEAKAKGDPEATPYGFETGEVGREFQFDDGGAPVLDEEGNQLVCLFPELECERHHRWYLGEGMSRQTRGKNQILFEDQLASRHKREIYNTTGTPDPSIRRGIFNRIYPDGGRPINSDEARRKHGAGFYKG